MAIRQGTIIPKAMVQNMPPSWPTSMVLLRKYFMIRRMMSRPIRIKMNAFERFRKMSLSLISNLDVLIKKMEKNTPIAKASTTSNRVIRNIGNRNISAPVLINTGGRIIFLADAGFLADFTLMIMTKTAMKAAPIEEINTKSIYIHPII